MTNASEHAPHLPLLAPHPDSPDGPEALHLIDRRTGKTVIRCTDAAIRDWLLEAPSLLARLHAHNRILTEALRGAEQLLELYGRSPGGDRAQGTQTAAADPANSGNLLQTLRAASLPFQVVSLEEPDLVADGRWFACSDGRFEVTVMSATDVGVAARTMRKMLASDRLAQALREAETAFMVDLDRDVPFPDEKQFAVADTVHALLAEYEQQTGAQQP